MMAGMLVGIKNLELAYIAGVEFLLSSAGFIGHGGEKYFHGTVLETVTWWISILLTKTKKYLDLRYFAESSTIVVTKNHNHGTGQ